MSESKRIVSGQSLRPTRRQFLAASGGAVATAVTASSYRRVMGANDRIRWGVIGTGGMGTGHIHMTVGNDGAFAKWSNSQITAVCDIYQPRLERAASLTGARPFRDYRELIASGLVDGVLIAAPEHWHYRMAMDAVHAKLDVYLQKAMTRTFAEAKSLYRQISKTDRVFQLGSQYFQAPRWKRAKQLYEEGHLGKVTVAQCSYCRNSLGGEWNYPIDEGVEPGKNLDWDAFMAPLPYLPYDPEYFFRWRKYRPFSAGILTDLMPHKLHNLCYVLGTRFPKKVSAAGGIYVHPDRDVGDVTVVTIEYEDYVILFMGSTANEVGMEDLIRGHRGNLYVAGNSLRMVPERIFADEFDVIDETLPPLLWDPHQLQMKEWLDSMRSRQQPTWGVEPSYKVMAAAAMAEEAFVKGRTVHFDEEKQEIL